ncbi:MAG TPA: DsbA family protein [Kofleriaceae bacterium]|nr:DsbA family protein [Kofleriaceae bacterium]
MATLELWFDVSCPYAYLASRKAPAIAAAAGVQLTWKPMLLGGVFRGIDRTAPPFGGAAGRAPVPAVDAGAGPLATLGPAKAANNVREMQRWAEVLGVPLKIPAAHPMRTVKALRTLLGLPESRWAAAIDGLYAAYWQRGEDITRDDVILSALASIPEAATALARADDDAIKAELHARTDEAIALGIFGAPAWVIRQPDREPILIWGQDRMPWVDAVLAGWDPDAASPPGGPRSVATDVQPFRTPRSLELFFDVASPYAYFALAQIAALGEVAGITPKLTPILLGALFRDIGQVDVPIAQMSRAKQQYTQRELGRWSRWWGVPLAWPHKFPQRTIAAQRLCVLAGDDPALALALGRAMWAEQQDLEQPAVLAEILARAGKPAEWLARTQDPAIKQQLIDNGVRARAASVFGVPTFVVDGDHLVWGQDRADHVIRMLAGWSPGA